MPEPGAAAVANDGDSWQYRRTWQKVFISSGAIFGDSGTPEGRAAAGDEAADQETTTEAGLPGIGDAVSNGTLEFRVTSIEQPGTVCEPAGA